MTDILRAHAQVERTNFTQLRSIGMTAVTSTGMAAYQRPKTFNLSDPQGYFVTDIPRRMNEEKELNERNAYYTGAPRNGNPRAGAMPSPGCLPGHPMTPAERMLAGKEAPKTPDGDRICRNYNSHMGCSDSACARANQFYNNYDQLSYALKIAMVKRYGFKKRHKLSVEQIGGQIKKPSDHCSAGVWAQSYPTWAPWGPEPDVRPRPHGGKVERPPGLSRPPGYTDQEDELRLAARQPSPEFGPITPLAEFHRPILRTAIDPVGADPLLVESRDLAKQRVDSPELSFRQKGSAHLSTFASPRVMHDLRKG